MNLSALRTSHPTAVDPNRKPLIRKDLQAAITRYHATNVNWQPLGSMLDQDSVKLAQGGKLSKETVAELDRVLPMLKEAIHTRRGGFGRVFTDQEVAAMSSCARELRLIKSDNAQL